MYLPGGSTNCFCAVVPSIGSGPELDLLMDSGMKRQKTEPE